VHLQQTARTAPKEVDRPLASGRVLHVLEAVGGGTARHVVDIVRHTDGFEHHVAVPSRRVGGLSDAHAADRMRAAGATVHIVEMRRAPITLRNTSALATLVRLIRTVDVDIVHGHSSIGGVLARLAAARTRRPCIYTPNGVATGPVALAVERALARLTTHHVAVSVSEAELLRKRRIAPASSVAVIPNGIEADSMTSSPNAVELRALLGVPAGAPLVGSVARLVPQKAPERFVQVAAVVGRARPDAHFALIGDGPLAATVDRAVASSGIAERFHRVDGIDGAEHVLDQLDVFVLTSRFEGGPYTPLEAMRAATPVVLTDVVGNRDVVENGLSGYVVAEDDVDGMAARIVGLLDDPELRRTIGDGGRKRLMTSFTVEQMCAQLAEVYGRLLAAREGTGG